MSVGDIRAVRSQCSRQCNRMDATCSLVSARSLNKKYKPVYTADFLSRLRVKIIFLVRNTKKWCTFYNVNRIQVFEKQVIFFLLPLLWFTEPPFIYSCIHKYINDFIHFFNNLFAPLSSFILSLIDELFDCLIVDWLIDWLINWLIDWLID